MTVRRALHCLLARPPQVFDRFVRVVAMTIVMGQLSLVIVQLTGEQRLYRLSSTLMQLFAPLDQQ
jgi:hypothetical protein